MDASRFDAVARTVGTMQNRRAMTRLLGSGAAAALLALGAVPEAAGKRRKKKITLCFEGVTIQAPKKKKKSFLKRGATAGECPCIPDCVVCGGPDGCGGTCGCPAGQACNNSACVPCVATLAANVPAGTIQLCAGTYTGPFTINAATTLIGAGNGSNPATSTILQGNVLEPVVTINSGFNVVKLVNLRVTDGGSSDGGGGVRVEAGLQVTLEACVITGNSATIGGGVAALNAQTTVDGCEIFDNAAGSGGGIGFLSEDGKMTITDTIIRNNQALGSGGAGRGGGLFVGDGEVTLDATVTITQNTAENAGGGVALSGDGTLIQGGADISNNTADQNANCDDDGAAC